ncbi:MAG: MauE/DoxX family redox-associated membrane protein [Solirubrobacterales bacterium]
MLLLLRVILGAVFAIAGVAKLRDGAGTRRTVQEFGVPEKLAPMVGFCLPLAELAAATTLVFNPTAGVGAIASFCLLALFAAVIAASISRGQRPDCNCFGQLHSAPVGWRTAARNLVLAALAVLILAGNGHALVGATAAGALALAAVGILLLDRRQAEDGHEGAGAVARARSRSARVHRHLSCDRATVSTSASHRWFAAAARSSWSSAIPIAGRAWRWRPSSPAGSDAIPTS